MVVVKEKTAKNRVSFPMICMGMFLIFMFINPDPYMGIADYFVFLLAYFVSFFMLKKQINVNKDTKIYLFMLGWLALSCVISLSSGEFSSGYILSYVFYILALIFANGCRYTKQDVEFFISSYLFSAVIICLFIIIFRYDYYGSGGERFTIQVAGNPAIDPNYLGAYLVVPFIIGFGKLLMDFTLKKGILVVLLGIGMLSTSSRGALVSAFIGAFITTLLYFKDNKKIKKIISISIVILIACIVVIHFVPSNSLIRLFETSYDDGSNSKRIQNWLTGLEAVYQRPLFGFGPRGEMGIIQEITGMSRIAHNTYIAMLMQFGVVGVLLLVVYVIYMLRKSRKNSILVGSLIGTLAVCFFISAQVAAFLWIPLILVSLVTNYERDHSTQIL